MAMKLVTAYYMHESELNAAKERMPDALTTAAFVLGEIEEEQIPELLSRGLFVVELQVEQESSDTPLADEATTPIAWSEPQEPTTAAFYVLRLRRPLLPGDQAILAQYGVELIERMSMTGQTWRPLYERSLSSGEFKTRLTSEQYYLVRGLPFVHSVRVYGAAETPVFERLRDASPEADRDVGAEDLGGIAVTIPAFDIVLHRPADEFPEDRETVVAWLAQRNVSIIGTGRRKIRAELDTWLQAQVRDLDEVAFLDEYVEPQLLNDVARRLIGLDPPDAGILSIPQTGAGQVVGIADTGIDDTHGDFAGRIQKVIARGRPGDHSDQHGHGTHVAGSVVGTGAESNGQIRGVAPGATLVFQSLRGADRRLKFPADLGDLLLEAYNEGARIHNNSWGANTGSQYRSTSLDVDDFIARHRDMLVVIAAGNDATAVSTVFPPRVTKGYPDWLSINAPATAKNALVVGASRTRRVSGGYSTNTWNFQWPERFPLPDGIASDTISGDPESLAGFSSRGPCMDDRIKPDVVAPGTDILSTRAKTAASDVPESEAFWGTHPAYPTYAYAGGTSMAAPLVAGCAALVRQYYVEDRAHNPSAALLKATIVNGARWLKGKDATEGHGVAPNFHQGFGAVYLPTTIPNLRNPQLQLEFFDPWQDTSQWFTDGGLARQWDLTVRTGTPLRICLVFTDTAASGIQNQLNLQVSDPETGRWMGNQDLPYNPKRVPDPYNNVQIVRINNPIAGEYSIKVSATRVLRRYPQDFALVVSGDLASPLKPS